MLHPLLWCCCVLVVQAMEHYENPQMLMELNSTKSDKLWFDSVRIPLGSAMNVSSTHTMDSWYSMLWRKAQFITNWCLPKNTNTTEQEHSKHIRLWAPCGYVTINLGIREHSLAYLIWTYRLLIVQIYFRLFEMDASNPRCVDSSSLALCQKRTNWDCPLIWRYCGRRQPWLLTTWSHKVAAMLDQLNVRSSCNLSFTYTSIDVKIAGIYNKYEHRALLSAEQLQTGFKLDRNNIKAYNHLLIVIKFGIKFHLNSINTCCFSGHIKIYAGDRNYHLVFHKKVTTQVVEEPLNVNVNYYLLSVEQYADEIHFSNSRSDKYFMLGYTLGFIHLQSLRIGEVTTLNNAEGLLYKGYHIRYNGVKFPNVSFTIRKFEGWNENYCDFGGYIWKQKIMTGTAHQVNNELGPFCSKSLPSHPFVGDIGPKYIVLGSFHYYLIFYAYGPLYNIDIYIHIHPSDCEGMFEPQSMCFTSQDIAVPKFNETRKLRRYIRGSHYETHCMTLRLNRTPLYLVKTYNIKKCLVMQSISLRMIYNQYYTFIGTMDMGLTVIKTSPYSSDGKNNSKDYRRGNS